MATRIGSDEPEDTIPAGSTQGLQTPMSGEAFALLAAWAFWCFLHSLLIANPITERFRKHLGSGFRFFRLAYVIFSVVTVVPLIHFAQTMDRAPFLVWEGWYRVVPATGLTLSALLFLAGGKHYDPAQFLGLRQMISGTSQRSLSRENHLDTSGILSLIRHPWYTATFLLLWFRNLTLLEVGINLLLTAYLVIGTRLEERKLGQEFGDRYRDYQLRVSMFFPLKWLHSMVPSHRR